MLWQKNKRIHKGNKFFAFFACLFLVLNVNVYTNAHVRIVSSANGIAECLMELHSRRILYANHAEKTLPMASTTKIATAITVLEHCKNLEEVIEIPLQATGIEGSSVYLQSGEKYTIKDLLYGLMLRSGNDCAVALALHCGGNVEKFADYMNETAQKAGALHTNFKNPHGLPSKGHYTTAKDLNLISCYAMENDIFREIVKTEYYATHKWKNKNKILQLCEGGVGIKTGYTKEAGRCLVSAAKREDMMLVCTLLNCPTTYERTIALFNDAFAAYERVCLVKKGQEFILQTKNSTIKSYANDDFYYPLLKEEKELIEIKSKWIENQEKSKKNSGKIGEFQIYLAKRLLFSGNLYKL